MKNLTTVFSSGTGLESGKVLTFGSSPGYRDRDRSWSRTSPDSGDTVLRIEYTFRLVDFFIEDSK
jgi:hypothetical protein